MVAVLEYDVNEHRWIDHRNGHNGHVQPAQPEPAQSDLRPLFVQCVAEGAERAKAALPENTGRIDLAVKIVLAGDVTANLDGAALVRSQSNGGAVFYTVNGACNCRDYAKAPQGWCKHKLAWALQKRAHTLMQQRLEEPAVATAEPVELPHADFATPTAVRTYQPAVALPEAPASANVYVDIAGRKVQITLRDTDEDRLIARLSKVMERYPVPETIQAQAQGKDWCRIHDVQMTWNEPRPGSRRPGWYSHRTAEGWCQGRVKGGAR